MDDDVADLVIDEIRNFFISITAPFLEELNKKDQYNARSWTQRVMQISNYPLMKNYLILLAYMIASGRVVSPFDVDARTCKLPKIPATLQEDRLFEYVRREIDRKNREDLLEATESALSRDDMAFLAQLPAPNNGIRLYLATSDTPFSEWARADKFPVPTKYDISAKDFTNEGLNLVRRKFERSETAPSEERGPIRNAAVPLEQVQRPNDDNEPISHYNLAYETEGTRITNKNNDSSAYEYDSLLKSPAHRKPRVQIIGLKKPEVYKCLIDVPPHHQAEIEEIADVAVDDLLDSPPTLITDEDFQKEQIVLQKAARWFGDPMYDRYRETIKKLLRRKVPVDTIRRNIHRCMRLRYKPGTNIPNWLRDSLDEAEPWHVRIAHLKMRLSEVLKNEYGVVDEDELFHLSNTPAFSENDECKARELIRRAEEGRIDPAVKNKFAVEKNRSCKKLMNIIDEILDSEYDPDASPSGPAAPTDLADSNVNAAHNEPKPWKCNLKTSHSMARESYEARQSSQRQNSLECSRSFGQQVPINGRNGSGAHCKHSSQCYPAVYKLDPTKSRQSLSSQSLDEQVERARPASRDLRLSNDSQLEDFNLEDERPDELFAKLPPDSSYDDDSQDQNRTHNKSSLKNSK